MIFGDAIRDLHLEITSRCTLACPRCQRNSDPDSSSSATCRSRSVRNELTRERFPDVDFVNLVRQLRRSDLPPAVPRGAATLRAQGFRVRIETNGSYRPAAWWATTATIMQRRDRLTFSIDGLEDTNDVYRVNARWPDIMAAVAAMRGKVQA